MDNRAGSCFRKKRMSEKAANQVVYRAKKEGTKLYKYVCFTCGGYHVSKMKEHESRVESI